MPARFVAQLQTVHGRNVVPPDGRSLMDLRYELLVDARTVYASEWAPHTLNPTWSPADIAPADRAECERLSTCELRVLGRYSDGDGEELPVYRASLDLAKLKPLNAPLTALSDLSQHTYLFQVGSDGVLCTERTYVELRSRGVLRPAQIDLDNAAHVELCAAAEELRSTLELRAEAEATRAEAAALREQAAEAVQRRRAAEEARQARADARARVEALRARAAAERARAAERAATEEARLAAQREALAEAEAALAALGARAAEDAEQRGADGGVQSELRRVRSLLEARQLKLVPQLTAIYPVAEHGGEYTIRGLRLPHQRDASARAEDDTVSTALGYTAHLVSLLSKFLRVPLRYTLSHNASRSTVRDEVHSRNEYPLFAKGVPRDMFVRAVEFLARDIEQLARARGVDVTRSAHMLETLRALIAREMYSI